MIKVKSIDHVAIAVADAVDAQTTLQKVFGLRTGAVEHVPTQKTDVVFLHAEHGDAAVELVCPAGLPGQPGPSGNEGLSRFLAKRGPGLHHICFEVEDLSASLATLKAAGVELVDEQPRPGARGHLVAFIHPRSTGGVLFELCQKSAGEIS